MNSSKLNALLVSALITKVGSVYSLDNLVRCINSSGTTIAYASTKQDCPSPTQTHSQVNLAPQPSEQEILQARTLAKNNQERAKQLDTQAIQHSTKNNNKKMQPQLASSRTYCTRLNKTITSLQAKQDKEQSNSDLRVASAPKTQVTATKKSSADKPPTAAINQNTSKANQKLERLLREQQQNCS